MNEDEMKKQIEKMFKLFGLSDKQIKDFDKKMKDLNEESQYHAEMIYEHLQAQVNITKEMADLTKKTIPNHPMISVLQFQILQQESQLETYKKLIVKKEKKDNGDDIFTT